MSPHAATARLVNEVFDRFTTQDLLDVEVLDDNQLLVLARWLYLHGAEAPAVLVMQAWHHRSESLIADAQVALAELMGGQILLDGVLVVSDGRWPVP